MAGKSAKCPKCSKPLKIPSPKPKQGSTATKKPKPSPAKTPSKAPAAGTPEAGLAGGAFDDLFDDVGLTKKTGPTCPQCLKEIKPGTVICTACGYNFESGETLTEFDAKVDGPEFDNLYLQEAANNMVREDLMDSRRDKAAMPWWVIMSFLIGAATLCAAGVIIVDGKLGEPAPTTTFLGKLQAWPVFVTLGLTVLITGLAIVVFAHFSITAFGFGKSMGQGFACLFLPLLYSFVFGIMNWTDNKAPVKAIMMALVFIGVGIFLVVQGGGFNQVFAAFS